LTYGRVLGRSTRNVDFRWTVHLGSAAIQVVQEQLCERVGTSRIPVRDAIRQLAHEGLVADERGQRGVASVGMDELADAEELVGVLHAWAARRVAETATDAQLDELEALHLAAGDRDDPAGSLRSTYRFHQWVNAAAGSPKLLQLLSLLEPTTRRAFPVSLGEGDEELAVTDFRDVDIIAAGTATRGRQRPAPTARLALGAAGCVAVTKRGSR
jgi:DNA-binding GntR family transcriptional regulator